MPRTRLLGVSIFIALIHDSSTKHTWTSKLNQFEWCKLPFFSLHHSQNSLSFRWVIFDMLATEAPIAKLTIDRVLFNYFLLLCFSLIRSFLFLLNSIKTVVRTVDTANNWWLRCCSPAIKSSQMQYFTFLRCGRMKWTVNKFICYVHCVLTTTTTTTIATIRLECIQSDEST